MLRKAILFLLLAVASVSASAQSAVGTWNIFQLFDGEASSLIDGKTKVYYVSANRLYSYDKESNETYYYSTQNKLSDTKVTGAFYNPEGEYLFVAYDTGNIDIVYDNGRVVNLPDIKDASLTTAHTINDVAFYKGKIYVATAFGMVVYDDKKMQVVESGIYGKDLRGIAVHNGTIITNVFGSYRIYRSPVEGRHNSWSNFSTWFGISNEVVDFGMMGNNFYALLGENERNLAIFRVNWDILDSRTFLRSDISAAYDCQPLENGNLRVIGKDNIIYVFNGDGDTVSSSPVPENFAGSNIVSSSADLTSAWTLNVNGLANVNFTTTPPTMLSDFAKPEAITVDEVAFLRLSSDGKRLYLSNLGATAFKSIGEIPNSGYFIRQRTNYIDLETGKIVDVSIPEASIVNPYGYAKKAQDFNNSKAMFGGCGRFDIDPENPDRYVIASNHEGFYVCNNGKEEKIIWNAIAPLSGGGTVPWFWDVNFDPEGNLWLGSWVNGNLVNTYGPYIILTKDKFHGNLDETIKVDEDWIMSKHFKQGTNNGDAGKGFKDMGSLFCRKSNMLFTFNGQFGAPLVAYDTKGTYANVSDDVIYSITTLTDQDGKTFAPNRTVCAVEDNRGRVWIGTTSGIYEITNPNKATDPTMTIRRLKVPRNDGTGFADYLLDTDQINDIAVDGSNRKWIATESSGVYLVSEDGDQIIEQFTTDNSMLPSNSVYSVLCDPNSNQVYFGLASGLVSYSATSAPAASDYSEIYAYPNPVRPDYTGVITITGLMDNSLVKIADASGNVFAQGRSNGGMFVWDGCDASGSRVNSGVYFVFASQNGDGGSSGAVTKILVVN